VPLLQPLADEAVAQEEAVVLLAVAVAQEEAVVLLAVAVAVEFLQLLQHLVNLVMLLQLLILEQLHQPQMLLLKQCKYQKIL